MRVLFMCVCVHIFTAITLLSDHINANGLSDQNSKLIIKSTQTPIVGAKFAVRRKKLLLKRKIFLQQLRSGKLKNASRIQVHKKLKDVYSKLKKMRLKRKRVLKSRRNRLPSKINKKSEMLHDQGVAFDKFAKWNKEYEDIRENVINSKEYENCKLKNGYCQQNFVCPKGFQFEISNKTCLDINECEWNNGGCKHTCINKMGYYYCKCPAGQKLAINGKSCIDVNECLLNNGHGPCQDTCINTDGSYYCSCKNLRGTKLANDKHKCDDIDECKEGTSGCSHGCINVMTRAFCTCPRGMILQDNWKTCEDVNECKIPEILKACPGCRNTIGSYYCPEVLPKDKSSGIICPPLHPPEIGFFQCWREMALKTTIGIIPRQRLLNTPGTVCQFFCSADNSSGGLIVFCGRDGHWISTENKNITCNSKFD